MFELRSCDRYLPNDKAIAGDVGQISLLWREAGFQMAAPYRIETAMSQTQPTSKVVVAEMDGQIVGAAYGLVQPAPPWWAAAAVPAGQATGELYCCAVQPGARRHGVGQALVQALMDWMLAMDARWVCAQASTMAQGLLLRQGLEFFEQQAGGAVLAAPLQPATAT